VVPWSIAQIEPGVSSDGCGLVAVSANNRIANGIAIQGEQLASVVEAVARCTNARSGGRRGYDDLVGAVRQLGLRMACSRCICGPVTGEVDPMPSRRDRLRVVAAVLTAVAVLAVVGRITSPEAPPSPSRLTPATTLVSAQRSVPPDRWVTAQLEVNHGGGPLVFGAGSLWVGAWRDREVVRIDPRSNRVGARFPAGGPNPADLAVDAGTIWVVHRDTDEVVRLDPRTGQVEARIRLGPLPFQVAPGDRRFLPSLVAVGAGAGWVVSDRGAVARIDAASNRVVAVVKLGRQGAGGIAVAGRIVWIAQGGHGMARIDAASNRLLRTVRLDVQADRVAADGGTIWVGGRSMDPSFESAGAVARIDATTGRVREIVPSGLPTGLAAGVGAVWITEWEAAGGALACIEQGGSPLGMSGLPALGELAVGGGAVWAADRRGSLVYRLVPDHFPCSAASVLTRPAATP
jgi:virginiamycin B lyase